MPQEPVDRLTARAEVLMELGRMDLAIREFAAALAEDADNADIHAAISECLLKLGRNENAIESADQAIACDPQNSHAYVLKANCLLKLGEYEQAAEAADAAIRLAPDSGWAWDIKSASLQLSQCDVEAIAAADEAIRLDPDQLVFRYRRFWCQFNQHSYDDAQQATEEMLSRWPDSYLTHMACGSLSIQRRDGANAIAHFREAARLSPDSAEARKNLEWARLRYENSAVLKLKAVTRVAFFLMLVVCTLAVPYHIGCVLFPLSASPVLVAAISAFALALLSGLDVILVVGFILSWRRQLDTHVLPIAITAFQVPIVASIAAVLWYGAVSWDTILFVSAGAAAVATLVKFSHFKRAPLTSGLFLVIFSLAVGLELAGHAAALRARHLTLALGCMLPAYLSLRLF